MNSARCFSVSVYISFCSTHLTACQSCVTRESTASTHTLHAASACLCTCPCVSIIARGPARCHCHTASKKTGQIASPFLRKYTSFVSRTHRLQQQEKICCFAVSVYLFSKHVNMLLRCICVLIILYADSHNNSIWRYICTASTSSEINPVCSVCMSLSLL